MVYDNAIVMPLRLLQSQEFMDIHELASFYPQSPYSYYWQLLNLSILSITYIDFIGWAEGFNPSDITEGSRIRLK